MKQKKNRKGKITIEWDILPIKIPVKVKVEKSNFQKKLEAMREERENQ